MKSTGPKLCLDCSKEIPDRRKRCWKCSYAKQAADSAERSRLKRLARLELSVAGDLEGMR
jgi:predicted amidophosphoribosyltransferase